MHVKRIGDRLWRWTAPHPGWTPERGGPGGWERMVGCVYYEPPGADAVVLIDPQAPPDGTPEAERFWSALDRDVERVGLPIAVLLSTHFHERSAAAIHRRYREGPGVEVWVPRGAEDRVSCPVGRVFRPPAPLPGGIQGREILGIEEPEAAFYLPDHRALVLADCAIGAGGGRVRVAPPSWAPDGEEARARYHESFRRSVGRLLDLPAEMLLVSHGEIVENGGRAALREAVDAPAWGE